ncbi:Hypothetical protein SRAE_2000240200 [Strongyloides ratti]|uniref:Uncharacterized protein n=1 Tax=Strongyloides ratti TaxID=34506 RepID=A0A090LD93_STRRB|nr:Hypothetical protein SRAE_2000240200 [Strongyloides ratti]CEF67741.1 Hypothetical protein SRAE_2000240200 [Strongyloides ratti]
MVNNHRRRVKSHSRGRWSVNLKVSVTTEGQNNGLIIQQGIVPASSYNYISQPDFNSLPTYSFNPSPLPVEMLPSSSMENLKTPTPSLSSLNSKNKIEEPLNMQTSPVVLSNNPVQIQNNKTTTLTTVEIFRAPVDEEVQFYKLPPEPVSITGQSQYVRAHGPQYETWNQIRTETLINDPPPIIASKSVQWKNDLEERLTVSSYSSYTDDTLSLTKEEIEYNDTPPKVYGLNKQYSDTFTNQSNSNGKVSPYSDSSSIQQYRVSSPSTSQIFNENRSQSPMFAHILRQQKIIKTESIPIDGAKVNGNEDMITINDYREGDLQIRPLSIDTDDGTSHWDKNLHSIESSSNFSPSYNNKNGKLISPRGRSPSILKNGSSKVRRSRSPSWEEHRKSDLYKTKDVLGNVIDLVGDFDVMSLKDNEIWDRRN